jgi:TPP-dependent trihydroxycyclohexane-1,2-dione (THcHDO) dehydratase
LPKPITQTLHSAVESITASNDTHCMQAMSRFWDSLAKPGDKKAILSALHDACDSIAKACDA